MKPFITFLLSFFAVFSSFSQDYENGVSYTFEIGENYFLLADSVNIRQTPDLNGKLVTQLPIGTPVKILSQSKVITRLNNFSMYWYEVQFGGKKKGFVWGGKIAKTSLRSTKDYDLIFHFGLDYVTGNEESGEESYYQVRTEKAGKQLAKYSYEGFGHGLKMHSLTNLGDKGLKSVDDIFYLEGMGESCGDNAGAIVLFHSGGKLHNVRKLAYFADVPQFYYEHLYFPADMEGRRDQVVYYEESGEWVDEEAEPMGPDRIRYDKQKSVYYKWDGSKLVETKK